MAQVIFYEKPGCINNARQKKLLRLAGHTVVAKNLLTENWAENSLYLRAFFDDKPVAQWFNRSAPMIKQGFINPDGIDEQQAISLIIADPLLIRRPLMQVGVEKLAGFIEQEIDHWIGLSPSETDNDLESCPQASEQRCHEY